MQPSVSVFLSLFDDNPRVKHTLRPKTCKTLSATPTASTARRFRRSASSSLKARSLRSISRLR